jgi:hypothetical protein
MTSGLRKGRARWQQSPSSGGGLSDVDSVSETVMTPLPSGRGGGRQQDGRCRQQGQGIASELYGWD